MQFVSWEMSLVPKFSHDYNHFTFWIIRGCRVKWNWDFEDNSKSFLATSLYQLSLEVHLDGSDGEESACSMGDPGLIPGSGRSPGEGNSNPLHCLCLENPHGQRRLVGYSPWGRQELGTTEALTLSLYVASWMNLVPVTHKTCIWKDNYSCSKRRGTTSCFKTKIWDCCFRPSTRVDYWKYHLD